MILLAVVLVAVVARVKTNAFPSKATATSTTTAATTTTTYYECFNKFNTLRAYRRPFLLFVFSISEGNAGILLGPCGWGIWRQVGAILF